MAYCPCVSISIRVAVVSGGPLRSNFDKYRAETAYADRPSVDLQVAPDETVRAVLARAARLLGVRIDAHARLDDAIHYLAFHLPEDDDALDRRRYVSGSHVMLVDEAGRITWGNDFSTVTYEQIIRAADAGVIHGDPHRPYLILEQPAGNGVLLIWAAVTTGLLLLEKGLSVAANIEGVLQFRDRLRRRAERGRRAVQETSPDLLTRGGQPAEILRYVLDQDVWHAADLGQRLGCAEELAEGLLEMFGYGESNSGVWRKDDSPDALFMRDYQDEIAYAFETRMHEFEIVLTERLERFLATGQAPGIPELGGKRWSDLAAMNEEEAEAWAIQRQFDDEDGFTDDDDYAGEKLDDVLALDLMTLRCGCGDEECNGRVEMSPTDVGTRLDFANRVDHFVFRPDFLALAADQLASQHEHEDN